MTAKSIITKLILYIPSYPENIKHQHAVNQLLKILL